ncbi:MAG: polysaccharide deacetylase family protein [Chloroflexota bacterium]|nr:polysaccharide deacetylase family protein [Chloroflexota bacterium]
MLGGTLALAAIWMTFAWMTLVSTQFVSPEPPRTMTHHALPDGDSSEIRLLNSGEPAGAATATTLRPSVGLTARFEDVPQEHAEAPFSLNLRFSEPVALSGERLRTDAFLALSGYVTAVEPVDNRSDLWNVTVAPDGRSSVQISLNSGSRCGRVGAICTQHLIPLANRPTATVPGPPLSVEFLEAPEYHSGQDRVSVQIVFSEPLLVRSRTLAILGLQAGAASIDGLRRIDDRQDRWEAVLIPESSDDLVLTVGAALDCPDDDPGCLELRRLEVPASLLIPPATIHLTFDDGPEPATTPAILDILARYDARATFFVVGRSVAAFPELIERMVNEGHTLGNHTWKHDDLLQLSADEVIETLWRTQLALGEHATPCFRPPFYRFNAEIVNLAASLGLRMILNTGDTDDWTRPGATAIAANIVAAAEPNAILVLHDGGGDRTQTVQALESALRFLKSRRYAFEPVCQ